MFEYDFVHWSAFFAAAFILNIVPGPDMVLILGHTVKSGRKAGTAAMLGVWTGAVGHVVLAALGLSALIAASATAFSVVKWVGAVYLIWIGIKAIRSGGRLFDHDDKRPSQTIVFWPIFRQGMFNNLLNPKAAIFFLAFLPQFVVENAGRVWAQLMLHGALVIVVAAIVEVPLVYLGDKISAALRSSKSLARGLDRAFGALLIGLGLRLALSAK